MKKVYVLFNVDKNQYWTGRFWDNPYDRNIDYAEKFDDLHDIDKLLNMDEEEENLSLYQLIQEAKLFEVKIIYIWS